MKILGIESSCDETAASVVEDGRIVLSNVIASQVEEHKIYGGVVPEIASRRHTEAICGVVEKALADANCTLDDIDAIGVTYAGAIVIPIGAVTISLSGLAVAAIVGIAIKKENSAAAVRERPKSIAPSMVEPEREVPGIIART